MALPVAAGDILSVAAVCQNPINTQIAINTIYYQVSTIAGGGITDLNIASFFNAQLAPSYKAALGDQAIWRGVMTRIVTRVPLPVFTFDNTLAGIGTAGTPMAPSQTAALITWYTNLAGRGGRGRTYIPFPSTTGMDNNGEMTPAYKTLLNDIAAAWVGTATVVIGPNSAVLGKVIYHRKTKTGTPVTLVVTHSSWATQRRRGDLGRTNQLPF